MATQAEIRTLEGIFDGKYECEANVGLRESDPIVPAFEETFRLAWTF